MISYQKKVIVSGNYIEVIVYEKPIFKGLLSSVKANGLTSIVNLSEKKRQINNLRETQTKLRRLINSNPHLDKFITLTFKKNMTDVQESNLLFKKFRQRVEYHLGRKLSFINVIEFQKRGAVHYHCLNNLPYIRKDELSKIWGQGFIQINRINNVSNIGAYVCKYLTKEAMKISGKKKYFHSLDLNYPEITINKEIIDMLEESAKFKSADLLYSTNWESPSAGLVNYKQFYFNPQKNENII